MREVSFNGRLRRKSKDVPKSVDERDLGEASFLLVGLLQLLNDNVDGISDDLGSY